MKRPKRILLVTGMSGAGRSTALKTLEDMGWETVDNLPLGLVDRLLSNPLPEGAVDEQRPLAIGIDSRTRGFDARQILNRVASLSDSHGYSLEIAFFDAVGAVLARRYSETRRRHPLAADRPAEDGIERERELLQPLRDAADHLIDTSETTSHALQQDIRRRFASATAEGPTLSVLSFGFARGLPRNADLVFDMRFLRNPHWVPQLRPGTGRDAEVAAYIIGDSGYEPALSRIEDLILALLPGYSREGKSYITIAFGCTGGRHRSVHCAERVGQRLRDAGFSPTISHRDLGQRPSDALEGMPGERNGAVVTVAR